MGSTYYSIHHRTEIFVVTVECLLERMILAPLQGAIRFSPLIRGYRKAQPPATISHPSGMKMEKLGNSCVEVVKYAYSRQVFQPAVPFQWRVKKTSPPYP